MIPAFVSSSAIALWMVYATIVGGLVALSAATVHSSQRRSNRSVRWIWLFAVVIAVVLPAIAPFRVTDPSLAIAGVQQPTILRVEPLGINAPHSGLLERFRDAAAAPVELALTSAQRVFDKAPADVYRALAALWFAVSIAVIIGFVSSYRRMMKQVDESPFANIEGTDVRISADIGPAVVGLAPSHIVVPQWLVFRPAQDQRIAIAHEVEHIRGRDPWMLVAACTTVALMPWNPALWYCLSRLRLAIEIDCDRRVLDRGVPPAKYGSLLIDFSAMQSASPLAIPAFPGTGSHLERRLIAMTERPVSLMIPRTIAACLVAATVLITACESELPSAAEIEKMDVTAAEKYAKTELAATQYLIDGKTVDKQTAAALRAEQVGSIRVMRGSLSAPDEIRIITAEEAKRSAQTREAMKSRGTVQLAPTMRVATVGEKGAFSGLLIVDGVAVAPSTLKTLSPDRIASMEVVKSAAAVAKYNDPRAAHGVIVITTRR